MNSPHWIVVIVYEPYGLLAIWCLENKLFFELPGEAGLHEPILGDSFRIYVSTDAYGKLLVKPRLPSFGLPAEKEDLVFKDDHPIRNYLLESCIVLDSVSGPENSMLRHDLQKTVQG